MRLIEEIERCTPAFAELDERVLSSIRSRDIRDLIRSKNGTLALSGAFVLFGCVEDPEAPMNFSGYQRWSGRADYKLAPTDEIFGSDVFGDLLFVRNQTIFRLDGETGKHMLLGEARHFLNRQLNDVAPELGGLLAREHFANRGIGRDPLRLLPTVPFMMEQHTRAEFFETPLSRAVSLKHHLFVLCRDAPEGAGIDCSFWRA